MKLLVFEYSSVCLDDSLINEGLCMLNSVLNDLEQISFFDTYFLIDEKLDYAEYNYCHPIYLHCKLCEWLNEHIEEYDYCLFIAPEDDLIQHNITKLLEDKKVKLLVSDSNASFICSSKYLTYHHLPENILKIKTMKTYLSKINYYKIKDFLNSSEFIIKPDNRTSSDLVYFIRTNEEYNKIIKIYSENKINDILVQKYIPGEEVSVSILCNEEHITCISLNSQLVKKEEGKIEYLGCITPISHKYKNKLFDMSKSIVNNIPGLKGFVGIDYIIQGDKIYLLEVNSRITTPYIVLQKKCNENLTEKMIKTTLNLKIEKPSFKDKGKFIKRG